MTQIAAAGAVFALCVPSARAQQPDNEPSLRQRLAAQEALTRTLMERLDAQGKILESLRAHIGASAASKPDGAGNSAGTPSAGAAPGDQAGAHEPSAALGGIRDADERLEERLDAMPRLSGYYDFEYFDDDRAGVPGEFRQHHVSLHISKELNQFRVFSEMEFEYGTLFRGTGTQLRDARGEVKVEQAWGEYVRSDLLTLRGGLILTPNYWNVNHYPNIVMSTARPAMVRSVFPESFVGLMAYGAIAFKPAVLRYAAYVSNGEGEYFPRTDDNESKAVGGSIGFDISDGSFFDAAAVTVTAYTDAPKSGVRTKTWGVETQLRRGPFEFLGEAATRTARENRQGLYAQPTYRITPRWATFYRYDVLRRQAEADRWDHTLGVNVRPILPVSLKFEYFRSKLGASPRFNGFANSIAIAF